MAGVEEVETFLERIPIVPGGVHFVNNAQGRSTGEAFVQIATLAGVEDALRRHRGCVGKRYIEVFKSSPGDMATFLGRVDARRQVRDGNALSEFEYLFVFYFMLLLTVCREKLKAKWPKARPFAAGTIGWG